MEDTAAIVADGAGVGVVVLIIVKNVNLSKLFLNAIRHDDDDALTMMMIERRRTTRRRAGNDMMMSS